MRKKLNVGGKPTSSDWSFENYQLQTFLEIGTKRLVRWEKRGERRKGGNDGLTLFILFTAFVNTNLSQHSLKLL